MVEQTRGTAVRPRHPVSVSEGLSGVDTVTSGVPGGSRPAAVLAPSQQVLEAQASGS